MLSLKPVPAIIKVLRKVVRKLPRGKIPLLNLVYPYFPQGLFYDKWNKLNMIFNLRDRDSWLLYFIDIAERYQTPYFKKFLEDGITVVDIGANNGYYSLLAATGAKEVSVFAFEANPALAEQLNEVIRMNKLEAQIRVVQGAVSNNKGKVNFDFTNVHHQGTGHIVNSTQQNRQLTTINAFKMDDWLYENKVNKVELMKIDVEGAEMNVLKGMEKTLKKQLVDVILIEVHKDELPSFNSSASEVFKFAEGFGYQWKMLPSEFTTLPGDHYQPNIENIPLYSLSELDTRSDTWFHCIAFSSSAFAKYNHLILSKNASL